MRLAMTLCTALILAQAASGTTYLVEPDGSGDFPTIQAAVIAAANSGDVVELTDGVFTGDGNRDIDFLGKALIIRSASGDPTLCTIDCEGTAAEPHRGFMLLTHEDENSVIEGITISHGWAEYYGGGIICGDYASPTITNCILYKNEAAYGGGLRGGAYSRITGCSFVQNVSVRGGGIGRSPNAILEDCAFVGNSATYGGGIYIRSNCSPSLTGCLFEGNMASHSGGGMHIEQHCYPELDRCTFTGNSSPIGGAIDISIESAPVFTSCTITGNTCEHTGVVAVYELCLPVFENSIIAFSESGQAVTAYDGGVTLICCDLYGNAGGDWVGTIADQYGHAGNISLDPLFCGDENPDEPLTLDRGSPCASDANPTCGLIGAWDEGCGWTAVEATSWGSIKALYR